MPALKEISLASLESELAEVTAARNFAVKLARENIAKAEKAIAQANKRFDKQALTLNRAMVQLRSEEQAAQITVVTRDIRYKPRAAPIPDADWCDEDQRHYEELKRGMGL